MLSVGPNQLIGTRSDASPMSMCQMRLSLLKRRDLGYTSTGELAAVMEPFTRPAARTPEDLPETFAVQSCCHGRLSYRRMTFMPSVRMTLLKYLCGLSEEADAALDWLELELVGLLTRSEATRLDTLIRSSLPRCARSPDAIHRHRCQCFHWRFLRPCNRTSGSPTETSICPMIWGPCPMMTQPSSLWWCGQSLAPTR